MNLTAISTAILAAGWRFTAAHQRGTYVSHRVCRAYWRACVRARVLKGSEMEQVGMGVMLGMLGGNADSVTAFTGAVGKTISALRLGDDDALHFEFDDGTKMKLSDEGQSCCELRYMRTDDNLADFVGAKLLGAELKEAPGIETEGEYHEVQFLEVQTDRGVFTMASHNEHNGYYGGFWVVAAAE